MKFLTVSDRAKAAQQNAKAARPLRPRRKYHDGIDNLRSYIPLECGHLTTIEDIERYRAWQPKSNPNKYFCELCGKWFPQVIAKTAEIPDEPLF